LKKHGLIIIGVLLLVTNQAAQKSIDYKFRILNQSQVYTIDPENRLFQSEQTYTIKNTALGNTRTIVFAVHPQLEIRSLILKDSEGKVLSHAGAKSSVSDIIFGTPLKVYELETESEIAPGQVLDFHIQYRLKPESITEWPKYWGNLTVSQNASFAITPAGGNNVVFGLNYSSPFVIQIRYPEGNLTCAPGNRVSTGKSGEYLVDTYESKNPNIPVFSCAPYKKIERRSKDLSVEFFIYPHETLPAEMADYLFAAVALYTQYFGDNGTHEYRVATAGSYNSPVSNAENKGNCIFMMDILLRDALKAPEGQWTYLSTLFHEIFHNWNLFSLDWSGDCYEWFSEGGATFIQAWAVERILGPSSARYIRQTILNDFIARKGFEAKSALDKAQKRSAAERALIYKYGALVWEQLRQKLGDEVFFSGLGDFMKKNLFKKIGFKDLLDAWDPYTKIDIQEYLRPWINHNARISLRIENAETRAKNGKHETEVTVNVDSDLDYEILTSLEYKTEKEGKTFSLPLKFVKKGIQSVRFESEKEPLFIHLDPDYRVPRMTNDRLMWEKGPCTSATCPQN